VYIALSSFEGGKQQSYPSVRVIAERAVIARSTVSEATALLARNGWFKVTCCDQGQLNVYECLSSSTRAAQSASKQAVRAWIKGATGRFQKSDATDFKKSVDSEIKRSI